MKDDIQEIVIYNSKDDNIFNTDKEYRIPLYQRPFAWEDKELIQLIEDIQENCTGGSYYYIGSLIVAEREQFYEVIDGQQRLTSFYLLLTYLGLEIEPVLRFACRDKSNYTLDRLEDIMRGSSSIDNERLQESIVTGMRVIKAELSKKEYDLDEFVKKLSMVKIYRIVVPKHTDMNRYFEIMNTRGEQLEQHDILKAKLMGLLGSDKKKKKAFSLIWEACSNMGGYVQMNLSKDARESLFSGNWQCIPTKESFDNLVRNISSNDVESEKNVSTIIQNNFKVKNHIRTIDEDGKDVNVRFESVIDFPYFLIHCLKVYVRNMESDDNKPLCELLLNDKKLNYYFDRVLEHGIIDDKHINPKQFSEEFIIHLLRMRYLFDSFIIKREYIGESQDGEWSLKTLQVSGQQGNKKAHFNNTGFRKYYGRDDKHKQCLMIQSALRVSYTSPKVMHWITEALIWLLQQEEIVRNNYDETYYDMVEELERIAGRSVKANFLDVCGGGEYRMGLKTPHIVFNFLDYILWRDNPQEYDDFIFEFRNSVEHWYPQNPSETELSKWDDGGVDRFGNLCIIQRNVNSKFSNLPPEGKKSSYDKMIAKGSLKLRLMSNHTVRTTEQSASMNWRENACSRHEDEMIQSLIDACPKDC